MYVYLKSCAGSIIIKMKVLQIVRSMNIGGLENYVRKLILYAHNEEQCDCLICEEGNSDYEEDLKIAGIKIHHIPSPDRLKIEFYKNVYCFLKKHPEYDVVHCHMAGSNGVLAKAAKDAGVKKVVCHSHGVSLKEKPSAADRVYSAMMKHLMQKNGDAFLACSAAAGRYLYGEEFFDRCGKVIPNGIELEKFSFSKEHRKQCRQELGIKENEFVIGHTGSLNGVKNQELLLRVAAELKTSRTDAKVILVGDGDNKKNLLSQVQKDGISANVRFVGKQREIEKYLSAMDVFVFPSTSEGFGISLLEAEANGLPCVVSERIQPEVKVLKNIRTVSLGEPMPKWAEAVTEMRKAGRNENALGELTAAGMSETACYQSVCDVYKEIVE